MTKIQRIFYLSILWTFATLYVISMTSQRVADARTSAAQAKSQEEKNLLDEVLSAILKGQFNETSEWTKTKPATLAGLFPTTVHINFQGEPKIAALRSDRSHAVLDLTSLATLLTLTALVEATVKGHLSKVPSANIVAAVEALQFFSSPQFEENSALMTIWPGCTTNKDKKRVSCDMKTVSDNAEKNGDFLNPYKLLHAAVKDCAECKTGKETLSNIDKNGLCKSVFSSSLADFAKSYNFPPDVTSSFANLALGALLRKGGKTYSTSFEVWEGANKNYSLLVEHVSTFAYRPKSEDTKVNVVDSTSYYNLAGFLGNETSSNPVDNVQLVTNWIPKSSAEGRLEYGESTRPLFNSVDLFGTATFLHAVTLSVLQNMTAAGENLMNLYRSNLDLMIWVLTNDVQDSQDLLMTSHPSVYQFYWQLARIVSDVENARVLKLSTYDKLKEFYEKYTVLRSHVTTAILTAVQDGGLNNADGKPLAFVDDFLGVADVDDKGKAKPAGDDRLFSTACAVNSLLAAWTVPAQDGKLAFLSETADDVKLAMSRLVNYVASNFGKKETSYANAFYSTLQKHCENLPYWFPYNTAVTKDGKNFTGSDPTQVVIFGMRGTVPSDEYKKMTSDPHFGHTLPQSLPGLDTAEAIFMFWSAPAYTQAACLLAVAQSSNLVREKSGSSKPSPT